MQNFKCFGCGVSGDVINYVERRNNLSFMEASEKLANEFGFELPKGTFDTDSKKTQYYDANRMAAGFFYESIKKTGNAGLKYMIERGISSETITRFGIGYADDSWDSLYEHLIKNGVKVETAMEIGLISSSKGKNYDRFRGRVMFPIMNTRSKVVGFGGRIIVPKDKEAKYINSKDSRAYNKSNNLYGINITRDEIKASDYSVLVEGYMDAVSLYQHGIKNVVASLGTALTDNQGKLLKRYSNNVVIAYDSDTAGQTATLRNIDVLRKSGCSIRVLNLGTMKDPDEYIKKYGKKAFLREVEHAEPFMSYKLARIRDKYDLNSEDESVNFLKEAARTVAELTPVEADFYIKKLSEEYDISEDAIREEAFGKGSTGKNMGGMEVGQVEPEEEGTTEIIERNLIRLLLHDSGFLRRIEEKDYAKIFKTPIYYRIYETIKSLYKEDEEISLEKLVESLEGDDAQMLEDISSRITIGQEPSRQLDETLIEIERMNLEKRQKEIISVLNAENELEPDRKKALDAEYRDILNRMKELKEW